jgi:hypothetical protein
MQPYALALAMLSIFVIFIVELVAFRWGTSKLAALGMTHGAFGKCRMLKFRLIPRQIHMGMVSALTLPMDLSVEDHRLDQTTTPIRRRSVMI